MLIILMLSLISTATTQIVQDSTDETIHNVTTLYPVPSNYFYNPSLSRQNANNDTKDVALIESTIPKNKSGLTWKVDTNYALPNNTEVEKLNNADSKEQIETEILKEKVFVKTPNKEQISDEGLKTEQISEKKTITEPKSEEKQRVEQIRPRIEQKSLDRPRTDHTSEERPKSISDEKEFKPSPKEFKPSQHLGNFFEDDNFNLLNLSAPEPFIPTNKPSLAFISSKDLYLLNYKSPKDTYRDAPYRFQTSHLTKTHNWNSWKTLESRPTVESSMKIPAGGLYKHPDPFREKPGSDGNEGDFGLAFHEDEREMDKPAKKRSNPWQSLARLVTAFLPVGLLVSALTPRVLTLHTTDNDPRARLSRRLEGGFASAPISESCKRRLLCEIHSDENYMRSQDSSRYTRKHCYKIPCEDPRALDTVLRWLLAHRPEVSGSQKLGFLHTGPENPGSFHTGRLHPVQSEPQDLQAFYTRPQKLRSTGSRQEAQAQSPYKRNDDVLHHHHSSNDFT